ncbi:MAG: class I adenylate-forming enzyme family protein [Gammaproteobacteria bacterium]|nr:class I adenylate-forming enzyme family protein [Gammaproteobacteria bacterium]
MTDTSIAGFEVRERVRDGHRVRVFKENHTWLGEVFAAFETFAADECLVCGDVRMSYAECRSKAARLAEHLHHVHDVKPGTRIGLALPNSPEWIVSFVAIVALGAVPALINPRAGRDEFAHCLEIAGCRLCIDSRMEILPSLIAEQGDHLLPLASRRSEDEALLMFTSGTTGLPKAASFSHDAVLTALKTLQYSSALIAKQMADAYGIDFETLLAMRPRPVNLLVFPLFHVSGCQATFLNGLMQGGKLVLLPRWNAEEALALIEREKVTGFPAVPTMYRDLLRIARDKYDLSSLVNMSVGGQATPPALLAEIHQAFPNAVLGSGYGMTEAGGTVTLSVGQGFVDNPHSVGRPVATFDVEIRDAEGAPVPANNQGEICIRGAAMMSGYVGEGDPALDRNGWFATGDLGYLDEEGCVYIVDRKTDMVISGGENIYCTEVERVLELHEAVRECAAYAMPDERLGEKLAAAVVLHPEHDEASDELLAHCHAHLAKHKVPKDIHLRREPLPRNAAGKVIKQALQRENIHER